MFVVAFVLTNLHSNLTSRKKRNIFPISTPRTILCRNQYKYPNNKISTIYCHFGLNRAVSSPGSHRQWRQDVEDWGTNLLLCSAVQSRIEFHRDSCARGVQCTLKRAGTFWRLSGTHSSSCHCALCHCPTQPWARSCFQRRSEMEGDWLQSSAEYNGFPSPTAPVP